MKEETTAVATQETQNPLALVMSQNGLAALKDLPAGERIKALKSITSYIGSEANKVDRYIGKEIKVIGCVVHSATVRPSEDQAKEASKVIVNEDGEIVGETGGNEMIQAKRTVFKIDVAGKVENIGFVADAAARFAEDFLFPVFGIGDFMEDGKPVHVPVVINQVSTKKGRTYAFQVV